MTHTTKFEMLYLNILLEKNYITTCNNLYQKVHKFFLFFKKFEKSFIPSSTMPILHVLAALPPPLWEQLSLKNQYFFVEEILIFLLQPLELFGDVSSEQVQFYFVVPKLLQCHKQKKRKQM